MSDQSQDKWKDSLRLPVTEFPMRGDLARREGPQIESWRERDIFGQMRSRREGSPEFVLHDGPPYANGDLHHGHALNKILKDIIVKQRSLAGHKVSYVPGWDCHGLPIEQKVDESFGAKKASLSAIEFRQACREYAADWVSRQSEQFERLMVFSEWDRPYKTMDPSYVASILRVFSTLADGGYVYRGLRPIHWSWAARTALAEAEVEYDAFTAPSIYVGFDFPSPPEWLAEAAGGRKIQVVIWTTTPWTLPSNLAVALHPDFIYQLEVLDDERAIVLAKELSAATRAACKLEPGEVLLEFEGRRLVGELDDPQPPRPLLRHPFIDRDSVMLPADYVTLEQGTGSVHTAPGHGAEDHQTGLKYGLDIIAPVDDAGCYTGEVPEYQGQHVFKANPQIIARLEESGHLLSPPQAKVRIDRYPHCWRTRKPLIFRATPQWFLAIDHNEWRQRSMAEIAATQWIPTWGEKRIGGMIAGRPDWCISRQRAWGVPIPVFACSNCGEHVLDAAVAARVADLVIAEDDADVWVKKSASELAPEGHSCPKCGASAESYQKGTDVLDVWFDSGVSWAAVLRDGEGIDKKASLYLEGSDQHRGWFHTSLLTGVASAGRAPFEAVLTHGFVVDDKGKKYAKSSPNFEPLSKMINAQGAELLRLWVSIVDFRGDMVLAPKVLRQAADTYRKIRNTIRFLLGNLHDYDPNTMPLRAADMTPLDRWTLSKSIALIDSLSTHYESYDLHLVTNRLIEFCVHALSNVSLDALKDRLYCDAADSARRRASQAVLYEVAHALIVAIAPVLSFTAEEAWTHLPKREGAAASVFLNDWPTFSPELREAAAGGELITAWMGVREKVNEELAARRPSKRGEAVEGQIGSSQQAKVTIKAHPASAEAWVEHTADIAELLVVSEVQIVPDASAGSQPEVEVSLSEFERCPRCWNHRPEVAADSQGELSACARCEEAVQ